MAVLRADGMVTRKPKIVHRARLMNPSGGVSPACAKRPYTINLKRATWTNRDEAVTCPRCLKAMKGGSR